MMVVMSGRGIGLLGLSVSLCVSVGCAGGSSGGGTGGSGQTGAAGQGRAGAGAGTAGQGGPSTGAAGGTATVGAGGASGAAGTSGAAGATGTAGATGAAGAVGATGTGGTGGNSTAGATGAAGTPGLTDPGKDGDGDFTVPSGFKPDPANNATGAPQGKIFTFVMNSSDSKIYPGRKGAFMRNVWAYVPMQYVAGTPAPFIVVQDGGWAVWFGTQAPHTPSSGTAALLAGTASLPRILDNYISMGKLPKMVALFVDNGGGDAEGSERGLEYDTVSGRFAEFIDQEVLPRTIAEAKTQLSLDLAFTKDPQGRATMGGSSGGAGSFSMAWFHPDLFARVISFSGTFVRQASPEDPLYPHGCWAYHDYDPFNATAPNGVIMKEPVPKPIRVWLEVGQNDLAAGSGPGSYRDFKLANQRMAASFLAKGYHYHFDYLMGAGHVDGGAIAQTLPGALLWVWRGYPVN
jgi:enterochelin esterase family protein